jgi:hypothetical protein
VSPESDAEEEDIQMVVEQTERVNEMIEVSVEDVETVSVVEVVEPEENPTPATASGRLASLREEIVEDEVVEPKGSIEDRMKDFFGDR